MSSPHRDGPAAPGPTVEPPIEPRPVLAAIGALDMLAAAWAGLVWLPAHRPRGTAHPLGTFAEFVGLDAVSDRRLTPVAYPMAWGVVIGAFLFGLAAAVAGRTWRNAKLVTCATCGRRVVAPRVFFGYRCLDPVHPHRAASRTAFAVVVGLLLLLVVPGLLRSLHDHPWSVWAW
jgi:hypothetical protein